MLTLDIIVTFAQQLMDVIEDISNFFNKLFSSIHTFLTRFVPSEVILIFGILIAAIVATLIFRTIINKR